MKKAVVLVLALAIIFTATGCSVFDKMPSEVAEVVFFVDGYGLQITADSNFYEDTGGDFDLQIFNDDAYISIMAFSYIDLPDGVAPLDVYEMQKEDIFSRRNNVKSVDSAVTQNISENVLVHEVYSAERDGFKNYYGLYLFDFPEKETFAWVLISSMPSYYENNKDYLNGIVSSVRPVE